jgi:hypothetical protein
MKRVVFLAIWLVVKVIELHATVLTFDIDGISNGQIISGDYGDRVSCSQMNNFHYGLQAGITPNVTIAYVGDRVTSGFPTFWATGYNDLRNVIENETDGDTGYQVILQADPDYIVQLESFDIGNWGGQINVPEIKVTNGDGTILFQLTSVTLPANSVQQHVHLTMPPDVRGFKLVLRVDTTKLSNNSDNIGLDNIRFSQDPPSPSPSIDIDHNGVVDVDDLARLVEHWLEIPAPPNLDIIVDCRIDLHDFAFLASYWLSTPPQD